MSTLVDLSKGLLPPKTTLEERQAQMRERYYPNARAVHNMHAGMDVAALAQRARSQGRKEFSHKVPGPLGGDWRAKRKRYVSEQPGLYRQRGLDARRFDMVDEVMAAPKNRPKGKTVVYQEGRHGRFIPGRLSAQTHPAEDTNRSAAVSFNTKPVWFNRKSENRTRWETFATHHELGHAASRDKGRKVINDQLNSMTNKKGRVARLDFYNIDHSAREEGLADRHGLRMAPGLGRKRDKGGYEEFPAYKKHPLYWEGRNDSSRDSRFAKAAGVVDLAVPNWAFGGIPATRADPISPLAMFASGNIMVDQAAAAMGRRMNYFERKAAHKKAYQFAGAKGMLYSPLGVGRMVTQ